MRGWQMMRRNIMTLDIQKCCGAKGKISAFHEYARGVLLHRSLNCFYSGVSIDSA